MNLARTAAGGNGGRGGTGGTGAAARSTVVDPDGPGFRRRDVDFDQPGDGGAGGLGRPGGSVAAGSTRVTGAVTIGVIGTPDGQAGANGAAGEARVKFNNNIIDLGDGNGTLTLSFKASGPGARIVEMRDDALGGGAGTDTLRVGNQVSGEGAVSINVEAGRFKIGNGPGSGNSFNGFEIFQGGWADDVFPDGRGDQTCAGGGGADRFEFTSGRAGDDRINGFAGGDTVTLAGFGPGLDDFADVLAATTQTGQGALVRTSASSSIHLAGVTVASLQVDDFQF